ncbi:MAG TPA: ATP synthase F1 subunit epsilon [Acidimicrobiales bacterium]|nr:ATP synthase F1 subunit epsilon [Acidimicrobiales bacterium]
MTLHVELVSPERVLLSVDASRVIARTIGGGDIAFLTGHAPFIGALDTWPLEILCDDGHVELAAVHGGFISVTDDDVKILSDVAELAGQIDVARAEAARARAEAEMPPGDEARGSAAAADLARANARLAVATARAAAH